MKKSITFGFALLVSFSSLCMAGGISDDFSAPKNPERLALRGAWTFENKVAHCVSDPELYKKFANHGPILRWNADFTDGTISFDMKPKDCQRIVVTLNEQGHVFRMAFSEEKSSRIFGWATQSSKENKPETLIQKGVPTSAALNDAWTTVRIAIKGDKAAVFVGDFSCDLEHACLARKKGEFTISFAAGALSVRNVKISTP